MSERIAPAQLHLLLVYKADTGRLYWRERPAQFFRSEGERIRWNGRYAGKEAFSINADGYRDGMIFRKMYRSHAVVWAMHTGKWPPDDKQIDHINGERDDNRIENLRLVTRSENCRNTKLRAANKSGVPGVYPYRGKWRSLIMDNGKWRHLGVFADIEAAKAARRSAEVELGYHENHGRAARHGIPLSDEIQTAA